MLSAAAFLLFLLSLATLPNLQAVSQADAAQDLRNLRSPRLWSRYLVSLLIMSAVYGAYSYFTPLLEERVGLSRNLTTIVLLAYGAFSLVGNLVVGKFVDRHAVAVLRTGHGLLIVSLGLIALAVSHAWLVITMVMIVGLVGVTMSPAQVTRVAEVGGTGNLVSTVHASVSSMGIALGTAVGGAMIGAFQDDPTIAMWTGAAFAVLSAAVLALQTRRAAPV